MENVIILIHGLGNKPSKLVLEHWWKQAINEGLRKNHFKTLLPKIEMVYWADVIHDLPLNQSIKDVNNPYYLDEKYTKGSRKFKVENHDTRKKIVDFLNKQFNRIFLNDDFSLNYSYLTDTIVGKYFKELEIYYSEKTAGKDLKARNVKDIIRQRLLFVIEKYRNHKIMLISHSMGSIVAYDVLNFLAPEIKIDTFVTMGSPLGSPIVVSKISAEQKQKTINNHEVKSPPGIVKNWYNFSDILDKVAFNYRLEDDFSENSYGVKPTDFLVINNYEMNGVSNPHKSFGYLRTLEFANILNEFIISEGLTLIEKINRILRKIYNSIENRLSINIEKREAGNINLYESELSKYDKK